MNVWVWCDGARQLGLERKCSFPCVRESSGRYANISSFLHHILVWEHRECWWEPEQIWLNESGRTVLELIDGFRWTIAPHSPGPFWCSARPLPPSTPSRLLPPPPSDVPSASHGRRWLEEHRLQQVETRES